MGPTTRDLIRSSASERAKAAVDCQSQSCHVAGGTGLPERMFRTLKHKVVLSLFHLTVAKRKARRMQMYIQPISNSHQFRLSLALAGSK